MNRTIVSDTKARKKFLATFKPEVVSISEVTADGASTNVPVSEQIETINAIEFYNQSLPAKRKAKGESLPEIPTNNVVKKTRFVKELKKKELVTVEKTSYH